MSKAVVKTNKEMCTIPSTKGTRKTLNNLKHLLGTNSVEEILVEMVQLYLDNNKELSDKLRKLQKLER